MPPPPKQKPPTAGGPGVSTPGVVGRGRDLAKIGSKNAGPGPPKPRLPLPAKASAVVKPSLASEACVALDMCVFGSKSRRTARASLVTAKTNVPVGRTKTSGPTLFPSATKKLNLTTQPAPAPSDTHEETSRDDRDAFSFQEHLGNTVSEETLDDQHDLDDAVVTSDVASPNGSASDAPGPKISNWRLARRAVFTHAYFREVREIGRDVGWSLLLGVVGDKKNAGDWLARNKKSPFAASARRENSRRNDRGRVILDEEKICDNTQTVGTSRVTMDSNHMSNTACLLRSAQKVSADWRVCRTESEYETLAGFFQLVKYGAEEKICANGDVADFVALVVSGSCFVVGKTSCDKKVVKKKLGPGAIIGEMGLLLGGFRKADVVACASGDDEDDFGNVLGNEEALGMRRDAGASSTLCVRIYFDAFVDFFAKHPDLATRAFGSLTNTATSRLKRWLLVEKEGREKKDTEENSEKENSNVSRRSPKLAETLDARRVYLALSGIADRENCFCQLHSEKDKKAFASVAAVVDANRHETVFSSGTVASKFGIVLKGSVVAEQKHFGDFSGATKLCGSFVGVVGFVDSFFRPAVRLSTATAGSAGSRLGIFDAQALKTLERKRPGVGTFLAIALGRAATAQRKEKGDNDNTAGASDQPSVAVAFVPRELPVFKVTNTTHHDDTDDACCLFDDETLGTDDAGTTSFAESLTPDDSNRFIVDETNAEGVVFHEPAANFAEMCFSPSTQAGKIPTQSLPSELERRGETRALWNESKTFLGDKTSSVAAVASTATSASNYETALIASATRVGDEEVFGSFGLTSHLPKIVAALRVAFSAAGADPPPSKVLTKLALNARVLVFEVGKQILRPNDKACFVGVLINGSASVVDGCGNVSANLETGTLLGENGLFGDQGVRHGEVATSSDPHETNGGSIPPRFRKGAVVAGEDATTVAVWHVSDLMNTAKEEGEGYGTERNHEKHEEEEAENSFPIAVAFVLLCARSLTSRVRANTARSAPRESFTSKLDFFDEDSESEDEESDNFGEIVCGKNHGDETDDVPRLRRVSRNSDSASDSGSDVESPTETRARLVKEKKLQKMRIKVFELLKPWRSSIAEGVGDEDVRELATALVFDFDLSREKENCPVVHFAPGDDVFKSGVVSCATLLVLTGCVVVRDGGDLENTKQAQKRSSEKEFVNQTKRPPGSFVGETEYFNRSSGEDAFLCAGVGESVRTIDAFACPTHGATVLVVSHETLDRLRVTRPSLALAMFSKMAGTAVQALIREIVASNS